MKAAFLIAFLLNAILVLNNNNDLAIISFHTEMRKKKAKDYVLTVELPVLSDYDISYIQKNLRTSPDNEYLTTDDTKTDGKDPKKGAKVMFSMVNTWKDLKEPSQISDAENSMLFCQLVGQGAINTQYNKDINNSWCGDKMCYILYASQWYAQLNKCLGQLGFLGIDFTMSDVRLSGESVQVNKLLLGIITAFATDGASLLVMTAAIAALNKLGGDSPELTLWDRQSHSNNASAFTIGHFSTIGNGSTIAYQTGAMSLNTTETDVKCFFFFNINSSNSRVQKGNYGATLDQEIWTQIKGTVVSRLGDHAKK